MNWTECRMKCYENGRMENGMKWKCVKVECMGMCANEDCWFQKWLSVFKALLHEKWVHVSATCNRRWKVRWDVNAGGGCTLHASVNGGWDAKHGKMRKHVFAHEGANAYEEMEMENGRGIMSFIVTFGEKGKSKYMGDENDIFLTFQDLIFNQIGPFGCNYK